MRKITLFDDEWSGLTRLAFAPMRVIFALEELGADVIEVLTREGLAVKDADRLSVTPLGVRLVQAKLTPFADGVRVWLEP
ncbi:hypothetical protein [Planctomyces sp. SH-PL14]|uniref:hypothetical protein n=1 Tax=Planctomyces sp. SH-PL14 TaxID=1632864 RepID=UPI00078B72FB|nr:hypothetical protein [Planctomyces sp. SH-PL14]AMV19217.1 hypothetical protein VT03_15105 [Planctomyces sp. SH-PL14]